MCENVCMQILVTHEYVSVRFISARVCVLRQMKKVRQNDKSGEKE